MPVKSIDEYIESAYEMGATDALEFKISDIVFDSRTLLKCMYGCASWGKGHTCPSRANSPSMAEYKEMLTRYSRGIIIHTHDKLKNQKISFELERTLFADGYYFAFSLSDCALCKECAAVSGNPCRNVNMARPAFHSVGIDVFKTMSNLSLPLKTLKGEEDEVNWYSAVFIE
ncbi:MAG: DUF2284 domain-containing protein [Clostridia bacterium]